MAHSDLVQSLLRGVDVMELVAQSERGLSLGEICTTLGLKQPTVHNLLRTLIARELVEKATGPVRYRLGPAVSRLAEERSLHELTRRASIKMQSMYEGLKPILPERLGPQEEATLTFSQLIGGEIVMLLRLRAQRPGVVERPRQPYSAYQSAAPLCFQAFMTPDERSNYMRRHPFLDQGIAIWRSQERLEEFLHRVRELGYALPHIYPQGQIRVGVPIFGKGHQLVGVLGAGVWVRSPFPHTRRLIQMMIEGASEIGAAV